MLLRMGFYSLPFQHMGLSLGDSNDRVAHVVNNRKIGLLLTQPVFSATENQPYISDFLLPKLSRVELAIQNH